jgi:glycosyltransferase involved in cell wall biosynthesis
VTAVFDNEVSPQVSIVMPVRNVQDTVALALRSVAAQSMSDWELVIVDDGSTDESLPLLREWAHADPRIRLYADGRSLGISVRLNQGIQRCRAALVARIDGDDICYPHRLGTQVAFLRANPDVDLVGGAAMVFFGDGIPRGVRSRPGRHAELTARPWAGIPLMHPTWMGRRSWFVRHRYDDRFAGCEDAELLLRAHAESRYANLSEILIGYREDRIKLRRSLRVRGHQTIFLTRWGIQEHRLTRGLLASAGHLAKGARDMVAVAARRHDLVLDRRNRPPSATELAAWRSVWASVTATTATPC